jgi:hypothetical protein
MTKIEDIWRKSEPQVDECKHVYRKWDTRHSRVCVLCAKIEDIWDEPQANTKPKIEPLGYVLEWERPTNTPLTDSNMSRIESKINEIISFINNQKNW